MSPENFCYWLQGWLEIQDPKQITESQVKEIQNHLDLVFTKVTPTVAKIPSVGFILPEPDCAPFKIVSEQSISLIDEKQYCTCLSKLEETYFGTRKCSCVPAGHSSFDAMKEAGGVLTGQIFEYTC